MATPCVQCCTTSRAGLPHGMASRHMFSRFMSLPAGIVAASVRRVGEKEVSQEAVPIVLRWACHALPCVRWLSCGRRRLPLRRRNANLVKDKSKALVIPLWQAPITSASHHKEDPRCASKYSAKEQKS